MQDFKKVKNAKPISKSSQKFIVGGNSATCNCPGQCIEIDFLTGNCHCVPC